jgi:hypothetical protein
VKQRTQAALLALVVVVAGHAKEHMVTVPGIERAVPAVVWEAQRAVPGKDRDFVFTRYSP